MADLDPFRTWLFFNLELSSDGPNHFRVSSKASKLLRGHVPELPVPAARPKGKQVL